MHDADALQRPKKPMLEGKKIKEEVQPRSLCVQLYKLFRGSNINFMVKLNNKLWRSKN